LPGKADKSWEMPPGKRFFSIELPVPSYRERLKLWEHLGGEKLRLALKT